MAAGCTAGTFLALTVFLVISTRTSAAPVHEDDVHTEQSQVGEYFGNETTSCYYNFQRYEEGDRIITNEPCLNCTCHKKMLMCYLRVCPYTKAIGQDCKVDKKKDQCCPVITCPEVPVQLLTSSTTPEPTMSSNAVGHLDNHGCTLGDSDDSTFYPDGAQIPQDPEKPCELCYCIRNRSSCVRQECTLNVEGCQPVYQKGVCCPVRYDCDYDETPTTERASAGGLILTTTPNPLGCSYNNEMYNDGELIITKTQKPCEHCYCMRGDIVCAVRSCGTPLEGKDCEPMPTPEGECCPTTYQCANGTIPLNSATLIPDNIYSLKVEDDKLQKPEEKPEAESPQESQEADKDKIQDVVSNNQEGFNTPLINLFENDDSEKPQKLPSVDSPASDKKESNIPVAQDKVETENEADPQKPDTADTSSQPLEIQQQVSSDPIDSDFEDDVTQDEIKPSVENVGDQETPSSIPKEPTPVHDGDGIQQIHVGQIPVDDKLVTEEPSHDVNLATSGPKLEDSGESVELEKKPTEESKLPIFESVKPGSSDGVELPATSEQETLEQVAEDNKPVEQATNKYEDESEEQSTHTNQPEADVPVTEQEVKDKPDISPSDNDKKPEENLSSEEPEKGGEKNKIETTGDIGTNEITKESQHKENQLQEKPNEENNIESQNKPEEQLNNTENPLQTHETGQTQDTPGETGIKIEEKPLENQQEVDQNKDQDTTEIINENKSQELDSTVSNTVQPHDSVNSASDETVSTLVDEDVANAGNDKNNEQDQEHNAPTLQSQDKLQPVHDHETKLHDSTPEETNQEENKPENIDASVSFDDVHNPTESDKPDESKPEDHVTEESINEHPTESNKLDEIKHDDHATEESNNDVSKPQKSEEEQISVGEGKPEEPSESSEVQNKPTEIYQPDEVQESGNVQIDETEKKPLDTISSESNKENESDKNVDESVTTGEIEDKPSVNENEKNVVSTPEVSNQKLENSNSISSLESDLPLSKPDSSAAEIPDSTVDPQAQPPKDPSEKNADKPTEDATSSADESPVAVASDDKSTEGTKITGTQSNKISDNEDNTKPTAVIPSENPEVQNSEETVTPPKDGDKSEEQSSSSSEDSKPSEETLKPHDGLTVQADDIEEQPESPESNHAVDKSSTKPEDEKYNKEPVSVDQVPQSIPESKPVEESSITSSDETGHSQSISENTKDPIQPLVETSDSLTNNNENKIPETVQSTVQDPVNDKTNEGNVSPNEVPISPSEPSNSEDNAQKQPAPIDTSSSSLDNSVQGENQQTLQITKTQQPNESGQETPSQSDVSEENKPQESSTNKQEQSPSELSQTDSENPVESNQPSKPESGEDTAQLVNSDKPDDTKQSAIPVGASSPLETNVNSGTVGEININNISPPVLHDDIETPQFSDEDEQPITPENSLVTDKPSQDVEQGNLKPEDPKPEDQSNVVTPTKVDASTSDNTPILEGDSSATNKPEEQKESSVEGSTPVKVEEKPDEKVQDVQAPTEVKQDNLENQIIESPNTNEISNDHKITFETGIGHGGIIHDVKETIKPDLPGPVGIQDEGGIPGEGSCLVDGKTYYNNSNVPSSNVCHRECKCISSVVHCFGIPCSPPPPEMENCMPIKQGDACCPIYACDANVTPVSLEAQNQMGSEGNPEVELPEQNPESGDKTTTDFVPKPSIPVQPSLVVNPESNIAVEQDEIKFPVDNVEIESLNSQVNSDDLPGKDETIVSENISPIPIDENKPQESVNTLASDNANSSQSAENVQSSDNVPPSTSFEQTPSLEESSEIELPSKNTQPSSDVIPTIESSTTNVNPLPQNEVPTELKPAENETPNSAEGISANAIADKESVPEESENQPTKPQVIENDKPLVSEDTTADSKKPTDDQNSVSVTNVKEPITSVEADSVAGPTTPVQLSTNTESQLDSQVNGLSDTHEEISPQETPTSNLEEPSSTATSDAEAQSSTEQNNAISLAEQEPNKEVDNSSDTSPEDKPAILDPLYESITQQSISNQADVTENQPTKEQDSISESTSTVHDDQSAVHEIPALPNIADETSVHGDGIESDSSDLEHIAPVFEIIEPVSQEEGIHNKPLEESNKDSGLQSSDELPSTITALKEEVDTATSPSDSKEENNIHESTESVNKVQESVNKNTPENSIKDVESSDEHSSVASGLPEDGVTPIFDNAEQNTVHEINESDDKNTEDPSVEKPSIALPDSSLPDSKEPVPVVDQDSKTPSEDPNKVEKPTTEHPTASKLPDESTSIPDSKEPSTEGLIESANDVQEPSESESGDPEKGTITSLVSEINTETPIKEVEKIVPLQSNSENASEDIGQVVEESVPGNINKPVSNDEIALEESGVGSVTSVEALITQAPSHLSNSEHGENTEDNSESSTASKPVEISISTDEPQVSIIDDNEQPTISNIDSTIIMDQKTESPAVLVISSSQQPAEEVTPNISNDDHQEISSPSGSLDSHLPPNIETKQPINVEQDDLKPVVSDEFPAANSEELPHKSDVTESTIAQEVEKESTSTVEEGQNKDESQQAVKEKDPSQTETENEKDSIITQENTPNSTSEEAKPSEAQASPVNVNEVGVPSADQNEGLNEDSFEQITKDSVEKMTESSITETDIVTKSPEILTEKDESNTATESAAINPINLNIPGGETSSDNELNKVVTPTEIGELPPKETELVSSEIHENTNDDKTETSPNVDISVSENLKPSTESEISTPIENAPSESEPANVEASAGEPNSVANTVNNTLPAESDGTEKPLVLLPEAPDTSIISDPALVVVNPPEEDTEVDYTPSQTVPVKPSDETLVETPESSPEVEGNVSSLEVSTAEENNVTENTNVIPPQSESDVKPGSHQTVIAETSSVHVSSSPELPEIEDQKPESPTDEGVYDDKITFPEVTDDSIQTSAPPSLIAQEALNELASGQQTSPQKPTVSHLPEYYPDSDSNFGPLPMPGWTPKPYLPETSSEESNTDKEEEHSAEGDMDYGGSEDGAFGPGTCRYGGKVYVSAQQIPRDDPCDFCFCFRSDIICLQQSCPPPIHRCRQESIKGFCCPRYECPVSMATTVNLTTTTTTTTTTLPPHFFAHAYKGAARRTGCVVRGITYQVGDEIKSASGPCLQCICGADGQMQCDPKLCSPEPMLRKMMEAAVSRRRR